MQKPKRQIEIKNFKGTREELLARYPDVRPTTAHRKDEGELDGRWICNRDLEDEFSIGETYDTREAAVAGAATELGYLKIGQWFDVGQLSYQSILVPFPTDADRMIENAGESLSDEWHEASVENWEDSASAFSDELEGALTAAWDAWVARHQLTIGGYHIEDVSKHAIGEDADDDGESDAATPAVTVAPTAQADPTETCTGNLVHDEFTRCPVHDV